MLAKQQGGTSEWSVRSGASDQGRAVRHKATGTNRPRCGAHCSILDGSPVCPLWCDGCWVPHLHSPHGGEPSAQPDGLLALVRALRARGCPHILCYSGYTYEHLRRRARRQPAVGGVLDAIDMLVDGPYVEALVDGAGPWTGGGNQRVLALKSGVAERWSPEPKSPAGADPAS